MDSDDNDSDTIAVAEPLSCKLCRTRKVRCNKKRPCNNCQKSNSKCVFPAGRRRPTQGRSSRDTELFQRLRHLETAVQTLKSSVVQSNGDEQAKSITPPSSQKSVGGQDHDLQWNPGSPDRGVDAVTNELGRLNVRNGRSRYTSNALWASLSHEIADMQELLDENTSEEEETSPPAFPVSADPWLGYSGLMLARVPNEWHGSTLHPTGAQMMTLWSIYEQNVNPVVKIFHVPSTKSLFEAVSTGAEAVSSLTEPALFSIYYAAVVSLNAEGCRNRLQEDQSRLIRKYRHALEQALARADFLNTSALIVLQAFVLFAICVRRHDDTRLIVAWCATAIRIAMSLGLHRDGSYFGLDPFQTEIRRRVWWHLVFIDVTSSRDHGMDAMLLGSSFDTRMPLNINDEDIYPGMGEPPVERTGFTAMTMSIARFETSMVSHQLSYIHPRSEVPPTAKSLRTLADKEKLIRELQTRLDLTYLQHCDSKIPLQWATMVNVRLACAMLWMIIYHPEQRRSETVSQDMKDHLFSSMVEVVESTRLLECNRLTSQWGWYFHNDVQWPAIAYVLNELLTRPPGPSVTRAWRVVDAARRQWDADSSPLQKGMLWRAVKTMTARAGLFGGEDLRPSTRAAWWPNGPPQTSIKPTANLGGNDVGTQPPTQPFTSNIPHAGFGAPDDQRTTNTDVLEDAWFLLEDDFLPPSLESMPEGDLQGNQEFDLRMTGPVGGERPLRDTEYTNQLSSWWPMTNDFGKPQ